MPSVPAYDIPSRVYAVHGEVVIDGPDGVGMSMTPDAAEETGKRLSEAAQKARTQPPAGEDDDDLAEETDGGV